jgi:hypothetical protein
MDVSEAYRGCIRAYRDVSKLLGYSDTLRAVNGLDSNRILEDSNWIIEDPNVNPLKIYKIHMRIRIQ